MTEPAASTSRGNRRATCFALLSIGVLISSALAYWHFFTATPGQLMEQALAHAEQDSTRAEHLLHRAIDAAGGSHPDAQLALCRVLLHRQAKTNAASLFAMIDRACCRTDLLVAFGRDALKRDLRPEGLAALEDAATRDNPQRIVALELLQVEYRDWGQLQKQLQCGIALTELNPENPQRWADLIELQTRLSQESNCVATIQRALQHDFPVEFRRHLRNTLVQQLVNQGDARTARRELEEWRKLEGDTLRLRGLEVYVCRLEGNMTEALKLITAIVAEAPSLPFPRFTRGIISVDLRQFETAVDDLEYVVSAQPLNAPAHFKLSEAYRGLGKDDQSMHYQQIASQISGKQIRVTTLLKKREADPYDPDVYRELEQAHREMRDLDAARHWHQWAIRVAQQKG